MTSHNSDQPDYFGPPFELDKAAARLVNCVSQGSGDAANTNLLKLAASLIEHVAYRAARHEGGNRTLTLLDLSRQVDREASAPHAENVRPI